MSVLVIGRNGRALMPTNPRKARLLLKKKTASVVCRHPFTIHCIRPDVQHRKDALVLILVHSILVLGLPVETE